MKTWFIPTVLTLILFAAHLTVTAATIDFSTIDIGDVSSAAGQDIAFTNDSVPATVNVHLLTGSPSSVLAGSAPDATGFYAEQSGDLSPMVFRFTFNISQTFTITQNESLANIEFNSFTLASGAWTVLSTTYATTMGSGSNLTFVGVNGDPPYGTYSIVGTGTSFDFAITNYPGYPVYGSAISVDIGSPAPIGPVVAISPAVRLQWPSESDKTYQPQYSDDPNTNTWTNFGAALAGTGQTMELFDSTDSGPKKFYRVQVQ